VPCLERDQQSVRVFFFGNLEIRSRFLHPAGGLVIK